MAVNPAIALGVKNLEVPDPLNQYSRIVSIDNARRQNELAQMQMRQAENAVEEQNRLRQFMPTLTAENRNQLLGYGESGRKVYESLLKGEKESREAEKAAADIAAARMKQARDLLPAVNTPETYANWRAFTLKNLPGLANVIPEQYSPEVTRNLMLEADKALEQHYVQQDLGNTTRVVAMPKYGQGPARTIEGTEARMTMTPGEAERLEVSRQRAEQEAQRLGFEKQRVGLEERRVGLSEASERRKAEMGDMTLSNKDIQKREAAYPQATSALKGFEAKSESFIKDLKELRNHPGLSQITGLVAGRVPAVTKEGRAAQALYDKILAKGGFEALQQMREASKTGGALGNVSNQEGKQLQASFAAIDRRQDASDVQRALDAAISDVEGARVRMREAYNDTYAYREQRKNGSAAPSLPAPPGVDQKLWDVMTPEERKLWQN